MTSHPKEPISSSTSTAGPWALAIVLLKDREQDLSEEQCLLASFLHMAEIAKQARSGNWTMDWQIPYDQWRVGKFRKIVKRATPQRFAKLVDDAQVIHTIHQIGGKSIELASVPPYRASNPDPRVKPLQVAGLDYASSTAAKIGTGETKILISYDGSLGASTGKMMAQSGHGAQLLLEKYPDFDLENSTIELVDGGPSIPVKWIIDVVDSGLTEIPANSKTVRVGIPVGSHS